jgi:hypothetical protein
VKGSKFCAPHGGLVRREMLDKVGLTAVTVAVIGVAEEAKDMAVRWAAANRETELGLKDEMDKLKGGAEDLMAKLGKDIEKAKRSLSDA